VTPLIAVTNLSFTYPDGTAALHGVDFRLYAGETVALFGANGSGKTTFVHHLNGILRGRGEIVVCGLPLNDKTLAEIRRKIGIVFQDADDQLFMPTILDDVAFGPAVNGARPENAIRDAKASLERVGIEGGFDRSPHHLSAGEKRRVAIAGVIASDPAILVLDEPTTFLDPPARRSLAALLRELPQAKILITHDTQFAVAVANRAVFFRSGKIIADGAVGDLVSRFEWSSVE
jgi:cobalt/nickel transport system ATP-binding protein